MGLGSFEIILKFLCGEMCFFRGTSVIQIESLGPASNLGLSVVVKLCVFPNDTRKVCGTEEFSDGSLDAINIFLLDLGVFSWLPITPSVARPGPETFALSE